MTSCEPRSDFEEAINRSARDMLIALNEHRGCLVYGLEPAPPAPQIPRPNILEVNQGQRVGGFMSAREPIVPLWSEVTEDDENLCRPNMTSFHSTIGPSLYSDFTPPGPSTYVSQPLNSPEASPSGYASHPYSFYMPQPVQLTHNTGSLFNFFGETSDLHEQYSKLIQDMQRPDQYNTPDQPIISSLQSPKIQQEEDDAEDEDEEAEHEPIPQRGRSLRELRPTQCGTGSHFM